MLRRLRALHIREDGTTTVEYVIATLAAAAFALLLVKVVTDDRVMQALAALVDNALNGEVP